MKNLLLVLIGFLVVCTLFEGPSQYLDRYRGGSQHDLGGKITSAAANSIIQLKEAVTGMATDQRDLPQRLQQAAVALDSEARRGLIDSQYRLSLLYHDANFLEEAYAWATVAAQNGSYLAGNLVRKLEQQMDVQQLSRGRTLVGTLQPAK